MKNNNDNIEKLLTDTFDNYTVPEYKNSWEKIKSRVSKQRFLKFNPYSFNIYYTFVATSVLAVAVYYLMHQNEPSTIVDSAVIQKKQLDISDNNVDSSLIDTVHSISVSENNFESSKRNIQPKTSELKLDVSIPLSEQAPHDIAALENTSKNNLQPDAEIQKNSNVDTLAGINNDTIPKRKTIKRVVLVQQQVTKQDTIVKTVIKKRRK